MKITVSKHQVENGGGMIFNCTFFFFLEWGVVIEMKQLYIFWY